MFNKKLLIISLLSSALIFSACGSDESANTSEETITADKITYATDDFELSIPSDWEILEKDSFTSNVPAETVVAFRNNIKNEVFTANVNINVTELAEEITVQDYAKSTLEKTKNSLIDFKEISSGEHTLAEDLPGYILEFEGKQSASESTIRFKQLYVIVDNKGYIITAAYLAEEEQSVVKSLDEMLDSFLLK